MYIRSQLFLDAVEEVKDEMWKRANDSCATVGKRLLPPALDMLDAVVTTIRGLHPDAKIRFCIPKNDDHIYVLYAWEPSTIPAWQRCFDIQIVWGKIEVIHNMPLDVL